jgi:hypothetical protein
MADIAYRSLVYLHLLLFVLWLGADVGVFMLGQHFRRRANMTSRSGSSCSGCSSTSIWCHARRGR